MSFAFWVKVIQAICISCWFFNFKIKDFFYFYVASFIFFRHNSARCEWAISISVYRADE